MKYSGHRKLLCELSKLSSILVYKFTDFNIQYTVCTLHILLFLKDNTYIFDISIIRVSTVQLGDSFGRLSRLALYSLYVYCTACSSCLKDGPVLKMNRILRDIYCIYLIKNIYKTLPFLHYQAHIV